MSRSQLNRGNSAPNPQGDDVGCNILHIDMDAFFALVEVRENPSLAGKQVIVGYDGNRGVVLSATYEARKLGVHSAMPMSRALHLAPNAIVVEPDHEKYSEVSENVMAIFESITPLVQPLSVDEAFLDISGAQKLMGTPSQIGEVIRARVSDEQGITCSVGVASTMFVAKLATNFAKPDGLHVVPADKVIEFLHPLPIGALWGVGEKTAEQLSRLGLVNVSDIANTPVKTLARVIGQAAAEHLYELSWGRDPRTVTPNQAEKSIGAERTFESDLDDPEEILAQILDLSNKVAKRLRAANYFSRTITIKVRFADFTSVTRSKSLPSSTDLATDIYATSKSLFEAMNLQRARIRLVGVRATGLVPTSESSVQLEFSNRDSGWREAEEAIDQVAIKFGNSAVKPARLIKPES
jgi:DNA polymerase IV